MSDFLRMSQLSLGRKRVMIREDLNVPIESGVVPAAAAGGWLGGRPRHEGGLG